MEDLLKKYNLTKFKYEYELKKSKKHNLSIEEWLDYKFSQKNSLEHLIQTLNSYEDQFTDLTNWEDERTRTLLGKVYFSDIGVLSRDVRNFLKKRGKDLSNIYYETGNLFFDVIKNIKNNQLFWVIFGWFYQTFELTSLRQKEFEDCLTDERMKISFLQRTLLSNTLLQVSNQLFVVHNEVDTSINSFEEGIQKVISYKCSNEDFYRDIFRDVGLKKLVEMNNEDEVKLFRGFKVDTKDKDMKIMDKENNKQISGGGLSYSLDKKICEYFSFRWTKLDEIMKIIFVGLDRYNRSDGIGRSDILSYLVKNGFDSDKFFKDKKYRDDFLKSDFVERITKDVLRNDKSNTMDNKLSTKMIFDYNTDTRGYVGEYTCRRGDISMYSLFGNEQECVVKQNKIKMLNYKIVTIKEIEQYYDDWSFSN